MIKKNDVMLIPAVFISGLSAVVEMPSGGGFSLLVEPA